MNLEELTRDLKEKNLMGYWSMARGDLKVEPQAPFSPCFWSWSDVEKGMEKAGEVVGLDDSRGFRRFIGFHNPALKVGTTHTLLLGAQLVKPGEIAAAHRHTMGAIRFVIRGSGAQTTIEGEPFPMEEGDLITTPNNTWHDHFNGSEKPIIWLDGADGPLIRFLGIGFSEPFRQKQQPHTRATGLSDHELAPCRPMWIRKGDSPSGDWLREAAPVPLPYRYRWEDTENRLRALGEHPGDPHDGLLLRYVNPLTGGPTLSTFSCEIQMLRPGEETKPHRHTATAIYHVFRGKGFTLIGESRYDWERGDSFVVPLWIPHRHGNSSKEPAILFSINDGPVMEALGFYREESQ